MISIASAPRVLSISSSPFVRPRTLTAVASASASTALEAMMVTLDNSSALFDVVGLMMWLCFLPSIMTNLL